MSKEKDVIRYAVEWDLDKITPDTLFRYIDNEKGYWCESMNLISDGEWYESNSGMGILSDVGNGYYDIISKEEAEKIAEQLGGSIYND
jgi:hypothetical protein